MVLKDERRAVNDWVERHAWVALPKRALSEFSDDDSPLFAGALAFFALFAIVPLVAITLFLANFFLGNGENVRSQLTTWLGGVLGSEQLAALEALIRNAQAPGSGLIPTLVGLAVLLLAASRFFMYLEASLNRIWDVEVKEGTFLTRLKKRLVSFALVLVATLVMLAVGIFGSIVAGGFRFVQQFIPWNPLLTFAVQALVSLALLTGLFMVMFRYLPDAHIEWRDAAVGAAVTAVLFVVGQVVIGRMLSGSTLATAFGGFTALVIVLLWLYYTGIVVLFGAEFTQVYARYRGRPLEPEEGVARRRGAKSGGPVATRSRGRAQG